jgi:serine/threonine-protein kinase
MASPDVPSFVDWLRTSRVLAAAHHDELTSQLAPAYAAAEPLARALVERGWLTRFQADHALSGNGDQLKLGSYVLLERLGVGGMGEVFKARHCVMNRVVALKVIRPELLKNPAAAHRFHQEIEAAAKLQHPNIVLAFDANEAGDVHFLAMEYVEGVDLARLMVQRQPLPVAEVCEYVRQAALGLQHAHEKGLVHRDVKPSNLIVTPQGQVKILDFGLARLRHAEAEAVLGTDLTKTGMMLGTPDYLPPEQARNAKQVDIRGDVYSLGCTFYHLLTGRPPFNEGNALERVMKHQLEEPPSAHALRPDLPFEVGVVLRRMMAKRPQDRFQTPAEVAAALAPFSSAAAAPAPLPSGLTLPAAGTTAGPAVVPLAAAPLPRPRDPGADALWVGLLGLLVAALVGGGVLLALRQPEPRDPARPATHPKPPRPAPPTPSPRAGGPEPKATKSAPGPFDAAQARRAFEDTDRALNPRP